MRTYRKLTQKDIDSAKPKAAEYLLADGLIPGFGARVRSSGDISYTLLYRTGGGKQRRYTIGSARVLSLEDARKRARMLMSDVLQGSDPAAAKINARRTTVESLYESYEAHARARFSKGHLVRTKGIFDQEILPAIGQKPVGLVTRGDIRSITNKKVSQGKKAMANNIHRVASAFLTYLAADSVIDINPLHGVPLPSRQKSRDRVLTPSEIRAIWHACDHLDPQWRAAIHLLILTGQRRGEVLGAKTTEIQMGSRRWVIPPERSKNRCAHVVYLSDAVLEVLSGSPWKKEDQFVFQSRITEQPRPIVETNSSTRKLKGLLPIEDWRLHDIRRSVATHMAKLGVLPHVIQVILNHRSGFRSGVTAIYNRHDYESEARDAWNIWSSTVMEWIRSNDLPPLENPEGVEL